MKTTKTTGSNGKSRRHSTIKVHPDQVPQQGPPTLNDFLDACRFIDAVADVMGIVQHDSLADNTIAALMMETRDKLQVMRTFTEALHDNTGGLA